MQAIRWLCVTNRKLCPPEEPFLTRLEQVATRLEGRGGILLREKDLTESDYATLAGLCQRIAAEHRVPLIVHSYPQVAKDLHTLLHLSMPLLRQTAQDAFPQTWGVSVHSVDEAREAANAGASYLIAGHIFPTDCKKGMPPRGLGFLQEVVGAVAVPVYAIGGITGKNSRQVFDTGAAGVCMMSPWMAGDCSQLAIE